MKKILVLPFLFVFALAVASAQENVPPPVRGNNAILFQINGFGDFGVTGPVVGTTPLGGGAMDSLVAQLGQLMGTRFARPIYGIGMKFFLSDMIALRAGVGFNFTSNETPVAGDTSGKTAKDGRSAFAIAPAIEVHLVQAGPVSFYTGGQVSFATASSYQGEDSNEVKDSQTGFGVGAIVGAEFFPWTNVSLGAEYQVGAVFSSTSSTRKEKTTDGPSSTDFSVSGPIRITASIYF